MPANGQMGYRADGSAVFIPDKKIKSLGFDYTYEPLKGSGYTMAVFNRKGNCVGWIDVVEHGFSDVKNFVSSSGYIIRK